MLVIAALVLIGLGAIFGGAGMRRLGQWAGRASGRWRPGAGVAALLLLFAGLAFVARGAWPVGLIALVGAAGSALAARKREAGKVAGPAMSEAEARSILGVGPSAEASEIQAAYRRLMQKVHPDHGGATGLARQLNVARSRLLD